MKPNIFFVCPRFYFYHTLLADKLREKGYNVDLLEERYYGVKYLFLQLLGNKLFSFFSERRYKRYLNRNAKCYDIVLVIRGETFPVEVLDILRQRNSNLKTILYEWDSLRNFNYSDLMLAFDKVYSFDKKDCLNMHLNYLPLFYSEDSVRVRNSLIDKSIDILMVSTYLPERIKYIRSFDAFCQENHLTFSYYLYVTRYRYLMLRLFSGNPLKGIEYHFSPLSREKLFNFYSQSKTIIDICNIGQSGLSMRVIEMIGAGKKILTTNKLIAECIDIPKEQYQIVDMAQMPELDFIRKDSSTSLKIHEELFIDNWLGILLS